MYIPTPSPKKNLGQCSMLYDGLLSGKYSGQFTTLFWFPAKDLVPENKAIRDLNSKPLLAGDHGRRVLSKFVSEEVSSLLPFLKSIQQVTVLENDRQLSSAGILKEDERQKDGQISVVVSPSKVSRSYFKKSFLVPIPPAIKNKPDTPTAIKGMEKASITLSVLLANGKPIHDDQACIHVYFPTEESTGVGFLVHGDFHITPDRKRLMKGDYNDWLLEEAAKKAAAEFLTDLLERYHHPVSVFEALAPKNAGSSAAAKTFVDLFGKWLKKRQRPFVPSADGSQLSGTEVVIPPVMDNGGFWAEHFSDILPVVMTSKKAFLSPDVDGVRVRAFLNLADVKTLRSEELLDFVEAAAKKPKTPSWWYECYCNIAREPVLSGKEPSYFKGRALLPVSETHIVSVPEEGDDLIVCLPPKSETRAVRVPAIFSRIFTFLRPELAEMIEMGSDTAKHWVQHRFGIANFEATDLLPRAIRGIVRQLFDGSLKLTTTNLLETWTFVRRIVRSSRAIADSAFWSELGRLPVPALWPSDEKYVEPELLIPAFLAYWPDSLLHPDSCLQSVASLRRVDGGFVDALFQQDGSPIQDWYDFFSRVGVSAGPVVRKYARVAGKDEVQFSPGRQAFTARGVFSGERQPDENRAVLKSINETLWHHSVQGTDICNHATAKVLQAVTVIEGLEECTQLAEVEYSKDDPRWKGRLDSLLKRVAESDMSQIPNDTVYCYGGSKGGHAFGIGSYFGSQLDALNWLPSTRGPVSRTDCFLRRSTTRLISATTDREELGDLLLPYVVVDNIHELSKLKQLGIQDLEDVNSASPQALIRALKILGETLSTDWGREEIIAVRKRWRLVRGAIQEIYRALNHHIRGESLSLQNLDFGEADTEFACRGVHGVEFHAGPPIYYAEPGVYLLRIFDLKDG